jgi:hypothetical protein
MMSRGAKAYREWEPWITRLGRGLIERAHIRNRLRQKSQRYRYVKKWLTRLAEAIRYEGR